MYNNASECLLDVYNNEISNLVIKKKLAKCKHELKTQVVEQHIRKQNLVHDVQVSRNTETARS